MYPIDVLSSYAICGAGALVGAAILRPSLAMHASEADALRLCRKGFALIGVGLLQPVMQDGPLPLWSLAAGSLGTVGGMVVMGWALAALAGERAARSTMWLALTAVLALGLAAIPAGVKGLTLFVTLGMAAATGLVAWKSRRMLMRPRNLHERLISVTVATMVASSMLRASYLLTWDGPFQIHLLHVPPTMTTPFALLYGVMSVVFATLINNVISARLQARLHQRAVTDHLTGALSRHALAEGAATLLASDRDGHSRLAVIMVDLDHFKRINDEHGHASGDAVLRHATKSMQAQLRPEALLVRYGGEEFVALVPVSDLPCARQVAERMRQGLQGLVWSDVVPGLQQVTASVGVTLLAGDESLERALARADDALYRAKNGGRNQVQTGLAAA
jgi:diguanylate cyclase (GGDEF)-like protein